MENRQIVTRHVVECEPNLTKDKKRELRAILHRCRTKGPDLSDKNRIRGMISHFQSINPELGAKFLKDSTQSRGLSNSYRLIEDSCQTIPILKNPVGNLARPTLRSMGRMQMLFLLEGC